MCTNKPLSTLIDAVICDYIHVSCLSLLRPSDFPMQFIVPEVKDVDYLFKSWEINIKRFV